MTLRPAEFIRRFLLHVLPKGFHRIRHYGLLAGAAPSQRSASCYPLPHPSRMTKAKWVTTSQRSLATALALAGACTSSRHSSPVANRIIAHQR